MENQQKVEQPNPLLLEPVLEVLFNQLCLQDLGACSSVCSLWRNEAVRADKRRVTLVIRSQDELKKCQTKDRGVVKKLMVRNLKLDDSGFENLMSEIGSRLSVLVLHDVKVALPNFHKALRLLPNLLGLTLSLVKNSNIGDGDSFQLFPVYDNENPQNEVIFSQLDTLEYQSNGKGHDIILSHALKTFPNLRMLKVMDLLVEPSSTFDGVKLKYLEKLIIINEEPGVRNEHLEMLMKIQFESLKFLSLFGVENQIDVSLLKGLLESHWEKLEQLDIGHYRGVRFLPVPTHLFPLHLPNLKYLFLTKPYVTNMAHVLNSFPNLIRVQFHFEPNSNWMGVLPNKLKEHKGIEEAKIFWVEAKALEKLAKSFTSLKTLMIEHCDDNIMRTIYANMPQLQQLMCSESIHRQITTEGLVGIPSAIFANSNNEPAKFRTMPSIANLSVLMEMQITFLSKPDFDIKNLFKYGVMEMIEIKVVVINGIECGPDLINFLKNDCGYRLTLKASDDKKEIGMAKSFVVYLNGYGDDLNDQPAIGKFSTQM